MLELMARDGMRTGEVLKMRALDIQTASWQGDRRRGDALDRKPIRMNLAGVERGTLLKSPEIRFGKVSN